MKRLTLAAVVTILTAGLATGCGGSDRSGSAAPAAPGVATTPDRTPSRATPTTPGAAMTPSTPGPDLSGDLSDSGDFAPVLWATAAQVHDGTTVVDYRIGDGALPTALWRAADGWVVTVTPDVVAPASQAWSVGRDGSTAKLLDFSGEPTDADVSPDGTRLVALTADRTAYAVVDVASGDVVDRVAFGADEQDTAASGRARFGGDRVFTGWHDGEAAHVVASVLGSDERDAQGLDTVADLVAHWDVSDDGSLLAADQLDDTDPRGPSCLLTGATNGVDARGARCDTVLEPGSSFSPDGGAVLGIPADTAGFGPAAFDVVAADGSSVTTVPAPELALQAVPASSDVLYVRSVQDYGGAGTIIYSCVLDGTCSEIGRSDQGGVLGQP